MDFWKLHGTANDFILIDNRKQQIRNMSALAKQVCHRRFGIGADGLMAAEISDSADIRMRYYNSDGSPATMCGNGIRCFAKFVRDYGILYADSFSIETGDGVKEVSLSCQDEIVSIVHVEMGYPSELQTIELKEGNQTFNLIFMHMGVPHCVMFLDYDIREQEAERFFPRELIEATDLFGPIIEKNPAFPEGTNVNFVYIADDSHLIISTWERGAGRTWACGTGACASAVAAYHNKAVGSTVHVRMPGGEVTVTIAATGAVHMQGTAQLICKGTFYVRS